MASENKLFFNYLDLFRYKSLRTKSIFIGIIIFSVDFLYYGPLMLIDQFGFNFYINGVIINISELITYVFSYFLIVKLKRRFFGIVMFSIALVCSFILIYVSEKVMCTNDCWSAKIIIQLIVIFIFRFVISF